MGALFAVIVTAIWGAGFVATRFTLEVLPPLWSNAVRFALAVALFTPVAWPRVRGMERASLRRALVLGVALYGCFAFQTAGLARTSVAHSSFITGTYVVFVPLGAALLGRERLRLRHGGAVILALAGLCLLAGLHGGHLGFGPGDLLTFFCALTCAAHILVADRAARDVDALALNYVQMVVTLVLSALTALPIEGVPRGAHLTGHLVLGLVYLALFSSCVAFTLQFLAQKRLSPTTAAMLFLLESPFGALAGLLGLGERLTAVQWSGAAVIVVASVLAVLPSRQAPASAAASRDVELSA